MPEKKSDTDIQQDVIDELDYEPSVDAADIGVSVDEGIVTVTGRVRSYLQRITAEKRVLRVACVRGITNDIEVRLPGSVQRSDSDIAKMVADGLERHVSLPRDKIKVKVENGWVTLSGELEWEYEKRRAANAVRPLVGVRGLTNRIQVRPTISPSQVRGHIRNALNRTIAGDVDGISITAEEGKIVLKGTVRSWWDKEEAEAVAWRVPGVQSVHSQIRVQVKPIVYEED